MAFASEFCVDVEGVGAVEVDVVMLRWCQVRGCVIADREAFDPQHLDRVAEIGRGPQHAGVGDDGQAQCLVDLVIEMSSTDVALVGEE